MKLLTLKLSKKRRWWATGIAAAVIIFLVGLQVWKLGTRNFYSVILLQNTDEKRATGGFLGSVALIKHQGWQIKDWQYQDIYDLDRQLPEFNEAPVGVQKYLMGGRNELHLQDANWERDFPLAAKQITALLQKSGQEKVDFVFAVNASLINKILAQVGAVTLDENAATLITSENFTSEARRDHEIFAANRQPKTLFLQNFSLQLRRKLQNLSFGAKTNLLKLIWQEKNNREWQAYAENWFYQKIFQLLGTTGETKQSGRCQNIYFVESNVGINKSNRLTQTQLKLESDPADSQQVTLTAIISNDNPLDETAILTQRLHYVNYQRLLLPPDVIVNEIIFADQPINEIDQRQLTDSGGHQWQEIGFLLTINEQSQGKLEIKLTGKQHCWQISQ